MSSIKEARDMSWKLGKGDWNHTQLWLHILRELRRAAAEQSTEGEEKAAVIQTSVGILLHWRHLEDDQLTHFVDSMITLHQGQNALSDAEIAAVGEAETEAWLLARDKVEGQAENLLLQRGDLGESDDESYSESEADSESEHDATLEAEFEFMARMGRLKIFRYNSHNCSTVPPIS